MEVSFTGVTFIQLVPDSGPIHVIFPYRAEPVLFKRALLLSDDCRNKIAHALHHDYEIIAAGIHNLYVGPAEVATVKDEAHLLVAVGLHLLQHVLELGDIDYRTWVLLIDFNEKLVLPISDSNLLVA